MGDIKAETRTIMVRAESCAKKSAEIRALIEAFVGGSIETLPANSEAYGGNGGPYDGNTLYDDFILQLINQKNGLNQYKNPCVAVWQAAVYHYLKESSQYIGPFIINCNGKFFNVGVYSPTKPSYVYSSYWFFHLFLVLVW